MAGEQEDYAIVRTLNFGTENAYFLNTGTTNTAFSSVNNHKPAMVYVRAIHQCLLHAGEHFWEIVDFKDHTASSSTVPYKPIEILLKNKRDPMRWMRIFANANPADNVAANYYNGLNFQFSDVGPPIGGASNPPLYSEWSQKDNWPDGASSTIKLSFNWSTSGAITDKIIWIAEFVDAFAFFVVNNKGVFNYSFMCGKIFETLNSSDGQHWNGHAYDRSVLSEVDATFTFNSLLAAWIPVDVNKRNIITGGITKVEVENPAGSGTWVEKLYDTEYTVNYANGSIDFTTAVTTPVRVSYYYLPLPAGAGQGHATSRGGLNGEGYLNKRTGYIGDPPPQHLWTYSGTIRIYDNTWFPIGNTSTIAGTAAVTKYLNDKGATESYYRFTASNVYIKNSNNVYRGAPYPVILKDNDTTVTPAVAMTGLAAFTRYLRAADKQLPNGSSYDSVDPNSQQSWRFYSTDTTKKYNDTILWNKDPITVPASPYPLP